MLYRISIVQTIESPLLVGNETRATGMLGSYFAGIPDRRSRTEIVREVEAGTAVILCGGEPTLRPDLPELIADIRAAGAIDIGIRTDGLPLGNAAAVRVLLCVSCAMTAGATASASAQVPTKVRSVLEVFMI